MLRGKTRRLTTHSHANKRGSPFSVGLFIFLLMKLPVRRRVLLNLDNVLNEEPLGIDRSHASCPGGRDGLAIIRILRVTARKHARDVGPHRSAFGLQIANLIHVEY